MQTPVTTADTMAGTAVPEGAPALPPRVSWGAVFAGGIVAIAVLLFMQRFSAGVIASVVGGGLILANADAIAGFFGF